jgi:hypothetical protein
MKLTDHAKAAINTFAHAISAKTFIQILEFILSILQYNDAVRMATMLWKNLYLSKNIDTNPLDFVHLSLDAMVELQRANKPNILYKLAYCIAYYIVILYITDCEPTKHPLRLHRLSKNRREDASVFVAGRIFFLIGIKQLYGKESIGQLLHHN